MEKGHDQEKKQRPEKNLAGLASKITRGIMGNTWDDLWKGVQGHKSKGHREVRAPLTLPRFRGVSRGMPMVLLPEKAVSAIAEGLTRSITFIGKI